MTASRILVVGDLLIDETWYVELTRLNPEAPTPTVELCHRTPIRRPGGAGFAAAWAASQGIEVTLITSCSDKDKALLSDFKVNVIQARHNEAIKKIRFIEQNSKYHLLRLDGDRLVERPSLDPSCILDLILETAKGNQIDGCLFSDYAKGFFSPWKYSWGKVIKEVSLKGIPCLIDSKTKDLSIWVNTEENKIDYCWLKLNRKEVAHLKSSSVEASKLLVTGGAAGATIYIKNHEAYSYTVCSPNNGLPDVSGCGDIFDIAFLSMINNIASDDNTALKYAVDTATHYAYVPLKEKLNGNS